MNIEDKLRTTLAAAAATIPVDEPSAPVVTAANPSRGWNPLLGFASGVAIVALLGLAVWFAPGSSPSGPPALGSAESMDLAWTEADVLPDGYIAGPFVVGPQGAIARAERFRTEPGDDTRPLVLASADGTQWSQLDARGFGGQRLEGWAGGYVSYGRYESHGTTETTIGAPTLFPPPAVWTSVDGSDWEISLLPLPSPDEAISEMVSYVVTDLAAATDSEMVAVGIELDEDLPEIEEGEADIIVPTRPVMWTKQADSGWELAEFPMQEPVGVAAGPQGIIAVDAVADSAVIWRRANGAWAETGTVPVPAGFMISAVGNQLGYAIGSESVWFSPDGANWTETDGPTSVDTVEAGPSSLVALGYIDGQPTVWWTDTGTDWTLAGTGDDFDLGDNPFVSYLGVTDHAIILAGQTAQSWNAIPSVGVEGYLKVGTLNR